LAGSAVMRFDPRRPITRLTRRRRRRRARSGHPVGSKRTEAVRLLRVSLRQQLGRGEQRLEFDVVVGQQLRGALLAVDDDEHAVHRRARLAERLDGVDRGLAGRGDVL